MTLRLPLAFLGAFLVSGLFPQQLQWLTSEPVTYGLNPGLPRHSISVSDNGTTVAAARLINKTVIYGLEVMGEYSVESLDPVTGQLLWGCWLGDSMMVKTVVADDSGNVYAAGKFFGDLESCVGSVMANTGTGLNVDLFLMKFDANGIIQWMRNITLSHPGAADIPLLAIDPSGQLWYTLEDFQVGELVRIDALANDVESRTINGVKQLGGVDFDPWGSMFVSGSVSNSGLSFGGQSYPYGEPYGMFVLRYDNAGMASWAHFAHDVTFQDPAVVCDPMGNAFVGGGLMDTTSFGGIQFNGPDWVNAVFITKVDSTGQFLWGVESDPAGGALTGDMARSGGPCIAADDSGRVYLLGTVRGQVDWGNGVISDGITQGLYDLTVVCFGSDGTPHWAVTSSPVSGFVSTQEISVDAAGAAYFSTHVDGPFALGAFTVNSGGQQASIFGRIDHALVTAIPEGAHGGPMSAWPVPARGVITLHYDGPAAVQADLFDATGQRLRQITVEPGDRPLDLGPDASGLYFLRAATGEVLRLVVE